METQTHVVGTASQISAWAERLLLAAAAVEERGNCVHVRENLEQASDKGPWRVIVTVVEDEEKGRAND